MMKVKTCLAEQILQHGHCWGLEEEAFRRMCLRKEKNICVMQRAIRTVSWPPERKHLSPGRLFVA